MKNYEKERKKNERKHENIFLQMCKCNSNWTNVPTPQKIVHFMLIIYMHLMTHISINLRPTSTPIVSVKLCVTLTTNNSILEQK